MAERARDKTPLEKIAEAGEKAAKWGREQAEKMTPEEREEQIQRNLQHQEGSRESSHLSFRCKGITLDPKTQLRTFIELVKQQLYYLKDEEYAYTGLHVYLAGVPEPWEFSAEDEFDLQEEAGVLIVRDGPKDENDNAEVPEYVFRLDAISATQLVSEE
jgi:hypothetical protein